MRFPRCFGWADFLFVCQYNTWLGKSSEIFALDLQRVGRFLFYWRGIGMQCSVSFMCTTSDSAFVGIGKWPYLSLCRVSAISLAVFPFYALHPHDLLYNWKFVPLDPFTHFTPFSPSLCSGNLRQFSVSVSKKGTFLRREGLNRSPLIENRGEWIVVPHSPEQHYYNHQCKPRGDLSF